MNTFANRKLTELIKWHQFTYDETFSKVADIIADKLGIEKKRIPQMPPC